MLFCRGGSPGRWFGSPESCQRRAWPAGLSTDMGQSDLLGSHGPMGVGRFSVRPWWMTILQRNSERRLSPSEMVEFLIVESTSFSPSVIAVGDISYADLFVPCKGGKPRIPSKSIHLHWDHMFGVQWRQAYASKLGIPNKPSNSSICKTRIFRKPMRCIACNGSQS